jgi:hypothetical protein
MLGIMRYVDRIPDVVVASTAIVRPVTHYPVRGVRTLRPPLI